MTEIATNIRATLSGLDTSAILPSEAEIRLYETRGWHVTPPIFAPDFLDGIVDGIEAHQKGERDRKLPSRGARFSDWTADEGDGVRNNEFCSLQNDKIRALVMQPLLGQIAARLSRSSAIRLFDDQAVHKPPATGTEAAEASIVGWHTDGSYWSTCTSERMLTAWVPLADTSVENGTLHVIEGSHLWDEADHVRGFNQRDLGAVSHLVGRTVQDSDLRPIVLRKGQVSFHHMRTLHASTPNLSERPRYAVAVHMQDEANAYRPYAAADGTAIVLPHDRLCREDAAGRPDYTDPEVFPRIWPPMAAAVQ